MFEIVRKYPDLDSWERLQFLPFPFRRGCGTETRDLCSYCNSKTPQND